mgnify:CR=1 FL=1
MLRSNKFLQFSGAFLAFGFTILQGVDWLFKKYSIDNKYFNFLLALLVLFFLGSLFLLFFKKNKSDKSKVGEPKKGNYIKIANVAVTSLLLFLFIYFFRKSNSEETLLNEILPQISKIYDSGDKFLVFQKTLPLIDKYPDNDMINDFLNKASWKVSVDTDLPNTKVYIKYGFDSIWRYLGVTPLKDIPVPGEGTRENNFKFKLINNKIEYIGDNEESGNFNLSLIDSVPDGFVLKSSKDKYEMLFPCCILGNIKVEPFAVSKYEVSNSEFKEFIENGGYENENFWDFPVTIGEKLYTYKNSIKKFTGKFGKFGPGNWSYGQYPNGEGDQPVSHISWFEARAYAKFKNLKLPNVYEWLTSAKFSGRDRYRIPNLKNANLNSIKTRSVYEGGNQNEIIPNIAGNVREWVTNPDSDYNYSILGGAFNDDIYGFNSYFSLSPFDRSKENGFRLVKTFSNNNELDIVKVKFQKNRKRNFEKESDVSDEIFKYYKSQFDYKSYPLDVNSEKIKSDNIYTIEKFSMTPPYETNEKLTGYVAYGNKFTTKLKPIIIFPNAGAIFSDRDYFKDNLIEDYKYLIDEGYAIIFPVYHSTFSREKTLKNHWPNESNQYKQSLTFIGMDFKRVIDYIESRSVFDSSKLSYLGESWGAVTSNILLAIDNRIKTAAIIAGGLMPPFSKKEIEAHVYLRRIKIPIMHLVGKLDGVFEYNKSFLPWNKLIGTPKKDKMIIVLEDTSHIVPEDLIIKNHLEFLKKYN